MALPAGSFSCVAENTGLAVPVTGTWVPAAFPNPIGLPAPNPVLVAPAVPNKPPVVPAVVVAVPKGFPKVVAVVELGFVVEPKPPVVPVPNPPKPVEAVAGVVPKRPVVPVDGVAPNAGFAVPNPAFALEPNPSHMSVLA